MGYDTQLPHRTLTFQRSATVKSFQVPGTPLSSCSKLDAELPYAVNDAARAADSARRAVECRDESVAGRIDFAASEALELVANDAVVAVKALAPTSVAQLRGVLR